MACKGFLECLLKLLNLLLTILGLAMVGYGIYLFVMYKKSAGDVHIAPSDEGSIQLARPILMAVSLSSNNFYDSLPTAWFIYLFIGVGAVLFFISCCGCISAATRNRCCLTCHSVLVILLILVEVGCAAFIFFDKSWRSDIPIDKTGEFDTIYHFLRKNWNICKWVALGAVILQALIFLLALTVRFANTPAEYDSDDEYISGPRQQRQPLIGRQPVPAVGVPVTGILESRPSRNDAWSARMREKYGLDTSEFTYNPNDPNRYQQGNTQPTEEKSRCTIFEAMRTRRGKRSEAFWPSMVMKKLLNIQPKNNDFSEDEVETENESEDDGVVKLRRRSETLRVHYIKTKDVRITIGTWNVAGRLPDEDLEIDEWLCTHQLADIYILGFQEVVPLSAGNVLGAETRVPVLKWESIIRKALNKSPEQVAIHKSHSAPTSPILNKNRYLGPTKITVPETKVMNVLDWPEKALDIKPKALSSGAKLRRVLSLSSFARVSSDWLAPPDVGGGLKRVHQSSGDLGLIWTEQQERLDMVDLLDDMSEQVFEEEDENSNHRYVRIVSKQMVGIYISLWVRKRLRRHINNLKVSPVGVGLMGYMGNKGSVSISMSLYQTRLCFVCSHLTSGHKVGDEERRNSNVSEILKRTRFSSIMDPDQPQTIPCHDQIFWFGDLNYRINKQDEEVRKLVTLKQWDQLLHSDQLCKELRRGHVFGGWHEGVINFPPTYKYETSSDRYVGENPKEGEKRRTPAWCDRILWFGKGIKQLCYNRAEIRMSDHRPVSSVFAVKVEVFDPRKLRRALNLTSAAVHPMIILHEAEMEL
ncbi:hypothetical protein SSX86_004923 [Deinandra increscens subsp. villosa]|uniref:Inositol polyphosphate-related phosphatase domain-containing protein n=1 Tax=Deinandra increscens subsp. villosa TaxID=3103831 RepID=A0AAP0H807_9ASTR